jgi:predicted dehydrogenase
MVKMSEKLGIGIIGCGVIAAEYAKDLLNYHEVQLIGVADIDADKARNFAQAHNSYAYDTTEALLEDD